MTTAAFGFLAIFFFALFFVAGAVLVCFKPTRTAGLIMLSSVMILPVGLFVVFFFVKGGVRMDVSRTAEVSVSPDPTGRGSASEIHQFPPTASIAGEKNITSATPETQKRLFDRFKSEAAQFFNKWGEIFAQSMAGEKKKSGSPAPAKVPVPDGAETAKQENAPTPKRQDAASALAAKEPRPDWIGKAPRAEGGAYLVCVTAGPYLDRQECEDNKLKELQSAFDHYVVKRLGSPWAGRIRPTGEELLALVAEEYEETVLSPSLDRQMKNLHLLVRFDRKVTEQIEGAKREWIVQSHLRQAGAGLAGVWLALGVLWGYLRLDQRSGGNIRGRLRLAAGSFLAAVAAAVWWAVQGGS
jgi:hypothetical protein